MELPTKRREAKSFNPELMVLFGKPKAGKSSIMAALDDTLIIDLENGYKAFSVMDVQVRTYQELIDCARSIYKANAEKKGFVYKRIVIDNATRLEEMALVKAAEDYRLTPMGTTWGCKKDDKGRPILDQNRKPIVDPKADIRTLPNGSGYLYVRNAIKYLLNIFKGLSDTLILVTHLKDKVINKDGVEMSEASLDLAGKTGDIICGEADAVGLIYREGKKTYIDFQGGDGTIRESRCQHLRGKKICAIESDAENNIKVDVSQLFI